MVTAKLEETRLKGIPICRGIAIGKPFFLQSLEKSVPNFLVEKSDVGNEIKRYRLALAKGREDVRRLQLQLQREGILEGAAILDAQLQIMYDPMLTEHVEKSIKDQCANAEIVFQTVISHYEKKFDSLSDPFFRERFKDIQDISRRVMGYLVESVRIVQSDVPQGSIIFSQELTTSDIAEADRESVVAFVSVSGGVTSHAAIVAKAKGIPYVTHVDYVPLRFHESQNVIVDGRTGEIIINPLPETLAFYQEIKNQLQFHLHKLDKIETLPAETYDGFQVELSANIEASAEVDMLHRFGGSGVGLFRSENAFLSEHGFPSEKEQFDLYRNIVDQMKGLPIVIRTFDVGGDKFLASEIFIEETNPYLGCRAIRFLLREERIFKDQLRAILRAAAYGNVSVMFPMVSNLQELLQAKQLIADVQKELTTEGINTASVRIGCMIEVPSAAIISDLLAKHCDFLSIGTNDLIQYALAVDRGNNKMSHLYAPTHPSVIRLIKLIVQEANHHGIPVSVCGEMAGDPRFTPLLLGLGIHELSVSARYLPVVKNAIRNTSIVSASKLAEKVLSLSSAHEIQELLEAEYRANVPEDVFYNV